VADNKTENATPHRRHKAREKGQVARSRELSSALALLAIVVLLKWQFASFVPQWRGFFRQVLEIANISDMTMILHSLSMMVVRWTTPALVLGLVLSALASVGQSGVVFAPAALTPQFGKLNPASNIKRVFSVSGLSNWLKSMIPMLFVGYLTFTIVRRDWTQIFMLSTESPRQSFAWLGERMFEIAWKSGLIFLAWSGVDYFLQRISLSRQLKMSKEEVKEESKDLQGNPLIKGRVRRLQREMRRRFMIKDVGRASVVIVNPTEYAVALEFRLGEMPAPVVVAKGRNLLAKQIREEANWHGIPIVQNVPLAQALYRAVPVGKSIPPALYAAVAEILAFIYRAKAKPQTPNASANRQLIRTN
jgi:flagellar biosynthesis protein FlhB